MPVVNTPDGARVNFPDGTPPEEMAAAMQNFQAPPTAETGPEFSGSILPFSKDAEGNVSFDSDAGLVGIAKRALTLPGEVFKGEIDPRSEEGLRRAFEMAAVISPMSAASRAAPALIPGARFRPGAPKAPTQAELKTASDAGYKQAGELGVEYTGAGIKNFADDVVRSLDEEGFIAALSPKTRALLSELQTPPAGSTASLKSVDAFRKQLNRIAGSPDPTEAAAANIVLQRVDRFLENTAPADVVAGPSGSLSAVPGQSAAGSQNEQAVRILGDARGNAAANFRSKRVTGVGDAAELRAAAANSGRNIGNTIRQRLASLILNRKQSRGFSKEETAILRQIVEGTATTNSMRRLSNMLGGGGGLGQTLIASGGAAAGGAAGGVPGAIIGAGLPAGLGATARGVANSATKRQLGRADEVIRMRSPLGKALQNDTPGTTQLPEFRAAVVRALMADQKPSPSKKNNQELLVEFLRRGGV